MTKNHFVFMCSCVLGHVCLCGGQKLEYVSHFYFQYNNLTPIINPTVCLTLSFDFGFCLFICFVFVFILIQGVSLTPSLLFVSTG